MIYTTNWIKRLNRLYKRTLKMRGALPLSRGGAVFDGKGGLGEKPNLLCKIAASFQGLGYFQRAQKNNI